MKTLVLVPDNTQYFFPYINRENVDVMSVCVRLSAVQKMLMRIVRRMNLPYPFYFGEWKKNLAEYEKVVLFDMSFTPALAKYIIRHSNAKVYVYLWNPLKNNRKMISYISKAQKFVNVYSYDEDDCKNYNMHFAPMMYSSDLQLGSRNIEFDLTFLGYAKDRLGQLSRLYDKFCSAGIICKFYVVADKNSDEAGEKGNSFIISQKRLSYQEYLDMIARSGAILDLVQGGQSGLSLRVLESVFLKKKLVTTNNRVKEYDLYRPENMFVLTDDNVNELKAFFAEPYAEIDPSITEKYDFANWLEEIK